MHRCEPIDLFDDAELIRPLSTDLALELGNDVGLTLEWTSALWSAHVGRHAPQALLVRDGDGEPIGYLPFFVRNRTVKKIPVKALLPTSMIYSTAGGLPMPPDAAALSALLRALQDSERWDFFEVHVERGSPLDTALTSAARAIGLSMKRASYETCPYLDLSLEGSYERFLASKSANFRSVLRRKTKKMAAEGEITLDIHSSAENLEAVLNEIFRIEDNSWKAEEGTAITSRPETQRFYSELALRMAEAGWLRIYLMRLSGRPIAFDYGLLFGGRYFMLKTSYTSSDAELSPGIVLRGKVIEDLYETEAAEHDFMWGDEHYKTQWSSDSRVYDLFRIYNSSLNSKIIKIIDR